MRKIKTIFEREGRVVLPVYVAGFSIEMLEGAIATEKLDGMNVRVTVRSRTSVRLEKRRNPDKLQKAKGIIEAWYVDTDMYGPEDKWLLDALKNTDLSTIPDGEWSGEALGPNIQGNPLNLHTNRILFFTLGQAPIFTDTPVNYDELKAWLPTQKSKYGNDCGIEGIVWHTKDGDMFKIKTKDFSKDNR